MNQLHRQLPASRPTRYVRPIDSETLARLLGEIDEADAVRGDETSCNEVIWFAYGALSALIVVAVLVWWSL